MTRRLLLATLFLSMVSPVSASEPVSLTKSYSFRVSVDEQGKVASAEPVTEIPKALLPTVAGLVTSSAFEPARVDGRAVPSRTTVHVLMKFEGNERQVRATPVSLTNGGKLDSVAVPRYPFEAMRVDVGAMVWATLSFRPDGSLDRDASRIDSVDIARGGRGQRVGAHQKSFEAAVTSVMANWTLLPDEVDGKPIAMTVRVPTRFCPPSRAVRGCDDLWPRGGQPDPSPEPSDTNVRLAAIKSAIPAAEGS